MDDVGRSAAALLPLIELPGVIVPGKRIDRAVFARDVPGSMGFADSDHVALMQRHGSTDIVSFDAEFDHVPELTRREA